jgi:dihydroorotase/N-acyl-D-amino-acid deacylase
VLIGAVQNPELRGIQGKTLKDAAGAWKLDPIDALCEILIRDHAFTEVAVFAMAEGDVSMAVAQPWVAFDNDSQGTAPTGRLGQEHPHPRAYGTFPRVLRKFVREDKLLSLEEAIRKMSALAAQKMRLADRGVLKAGMWADIVVFDPASVTDVATFAEPNQLSKGMDAVLVNGVPVIAGGKATGALPGRVLRGAGTR